MQLAELLDLAIKDAVTAIEKRLSRNLNSSELLYLWSVRRRLLINLRV